MTRIYGALFSFTCWLAACNASTNQQSPSSGSFNSSNQSNAQSKVSSDSLGYQMIYQRGIEAVLWSMPAMSDVFFRESLFRDFGMKPNQILVMSKPLVARHEVLTANNQVNYAGMPFDLSAGPLVLEIPASGSDYAIIGEICDNWQFPITMVGAEGPDKSKGGKYLLLPPGYANKIPAGYLPVQLEGYQGTMIFRPVIIGKGTMGGSIALANTTKAYLLKDGPSAAMPVIDGWEKAWHSLPVYDVTWFSYLSKFINEEPIREQDKAMIGMLSTLGIEKGRAFTPDANTTKALNAASADAYKIMQDAWTFPGKALTAWWPDRQWMNMNPALLAKMGKGWSFATKDAVWYYDRAIAPFFWANYLPVKLGGEQLYLMGLRDSKGELLSGNSSYKIRIPSDVPVDKFWSVIVYSQKTKSFIPNSQGTVGLDSYDKGKLLRMNADSSVDIYLGNSAPSAFESNWIPSAGEDFFLIFRFYGPGKSVYDKSWKAPDIEKIN